MFEEGGDCRGRAWMRSCSRQSESGDGSRMTGADQLFVVQAEHLLAGVAEGAMAEVVKQGSGVENSPDAFSRARIRVATSAAKGPSARWKHPQGMGEAT